MGKKRSRFVKPEVIRIDISDGDWIEIKKELTVGEAKDKFGAAIKQMGGNFGEEPKWDLDPIALSFSKVNAHLIGWSFANEDEEGNTSPVELTPDAIRSLDESTFDEIEKAIDEHVEAQDKEKADGGKQKSAKT